ncbi:MAG TPA: hypothetical protein VIS75_12420 [Chitinophagaceae bacterium]|jgi:hypothetical protein
MNLNFFNQRSLLYEFRWYIVIVFSVAAFMLYHEIPGGRMFTSSKQQEWKASGPGSHK